MLITKIAPFKGLINVLIESVPDHNGPITSSSHILRRKRSNMMNDTIRGTLLSYFRTLLREHSFVALLPLPSQCEGNVHKINLSFHRCKNLFLTSNLCNYNVKL